MRVLLVTSPHVRHAGVLQSDFLPEASLMYSFAPVGLLSLLAMLRRERPTTSCQIYDLNRKILSGAFPLDATFYRAVAQDICSSSPDVIGFMTECDSYHHVLQFATAIKQIQPQCKFVLGGPHASAVARQTMERCNAVDAVVIGEGELTFVELLDSFEAGSSAPVPGALVRQQGVLAGRPRDLVQSLDDLPIPAYDVYRPDEGEELFIEVGRGCPFKCEFCSTAPFWGRRHRVKSPHRILSEINIIRDLFGTTRAHFTHDLFTTDQKWVHSVCETLIDAGVPLRWTCSARTDTVDQALLTLMAKAGCNAIYFGIESGSERILREIRKEIPLPRSFKILEACSQVGITPNAGFIVGFPTEDKHSIRDTLSAYEKALRLGSRPTHLFGYCPFADSSLYSKLKDMKCSGHFVDIPLGSQTDLENRKRVADDADLYGAFFRPVLEDVLVGEDNALEGVDEFSPLVEAALAPTLALAEFIGGIHEVFLRWVPWIRHRNKTREAAEYRRSYGTPAAFAAFVLHEMRATERASRAMLEMAQAVEMNLRIAEDTSPSGSLTMASHRSVVLPTVETASRLTLDTQLTLGSIVGTSAFSYDVSPALLGESEPILKEEPTYLVWQRTGDRNVRLLRVDQKIFESLAALKRGPATAGGLFLDRIYDESVGPARADELDSESLLAALTTAEREGLIVIGASK